MIRLSQRRVYVDALGHDEADAIVPIHAESFIRGWAPEEFAALLSDRSVFALAARSVSFLGARRVAGFVLVRMAADEAEILTIAVAGRQRGAGFGRLLLEEALRKLYRERIVSCFLEVDRDNRPAVGLYRSLGFVTVGERKGYYRAADGDSAALVMRLQLR